MTDTDLDVPAGQIVHWLRDELAGGNTAIEVRATREYVAEPLAHPEEAGLEEDTEAASLVTVGTLEARPVGAEDGWVLEIRVEDVVGPHTPEDESVQEAPEEIDLDDFIAQFIAPDRGTAYVTVRTDTAEANRRFGRVFGALIRDRHKRS